MTSSRLGIAGSGAIACGLAATAAQHGDGACCWRARSSSAERARATVERTLARLDEEVDPAARADRDRPARAGRATFVVEAIVEDHDAKAGAARATLNASLGPDASSPRTTSSLSVGRAGRGERAPGALRRPARVQPGAEDAAGRAGLPRGGERRTRARARWRCARRSARRRSRCPTCRASSSTGCCSPTCSARCACSRRRGLDAGGDRHVHDASAPATRWARWRCSTSSASTSPTRSASRSAPRSPPRVQRAGRRGRARAARAGAASTPTEIAALIADLQTEL